MANKPKVAIGLFAFAVAVGIALLTWRSAPWGDDEPEENAHQSTTIAEVPIERSSAVDVVADPQPQQEQTPSERSERAVASAGEPLLLEPEYGSPAYLNARDQAATLAEGALQRRILLLNPKVASELLRADREDSGKLSYPIIISPYLDKPCTITTIKKGQQIPNYLRLNAKCAGSEGGGRRLSVDRFRRGGRPYGFNSWRFSRRRQHRGTGS